jgi:DNA-binding response OmpR family regulator
MMSMDSNCPSCGSQDNGSRGRGHTAVVAAGSGDARNRVVADLRRLGFDVVIYPVAQGLLDELVHLRPSVVILGVLLGGELGVTICEEARDHPALERTRFVLLGAVHRPERYRARPRNLYGADAYIEEPIGPGALREIVESMALKR